MVNSSDYYIQLGGVAVLGGLAFLARVLWIWYHQGPEAAHAEISRRPSPAPSLAPPPQLVAGRRSAARRSASDPVILERPVPVRISISEHTPAPTLASEGVDAELGELPGQAEVDVRELERNELALAENQRASLNSSLAETLSAVLDRWRGQRNQVAPAAQESPA